MQEVQRVRSEQSELQRAHEDLVMRAAKVCSHEIGFDWFNLFKSTIEVVRVRLVLSFFNS